MKNTLYSVCMFKQGGHMQAAAPTRHQRTTFRSEDSSLFTMWVPGIKLTSPGLVSGGVSHSEPSHWPLVFLNMSKSYIQCL